MNTTQQTAEISTDEAPEAWETVWNTLAPHLPTEGLQALVRALETDTEELLQGSTVYPPPVAQYLRWDAQAACLVGYCGWKGMRLNTVSGVEDYFSEMCEVIDTDMGEKSACRYLLNWWDDTPREEAFAKILPKVREELNRRNQETV